MKLEHYQRHIHICTVYYGISNFHTGIRYLFTTGINDITGNTVFSVNHLPIYGIYIIYYNIYYGYIL